jgi:hypothetical protein
VTDVDAARRTRSLGEEFPMGPRGVETGMVAKALPWALVLAPICIGGGWLYAGVDGLVSAVIGVALGLGNLVLAAFMLERATRIGGNAVLATALGGFFVRLFALLGIVLLLGRLSFIDVPTLAVVLVVNYLGLLVIEALVVTADDRRRDRARVHKRSQSTGVPEQEAA